MRTGHTLHIPTENGEQLYDFTDFVFQDSVLYAQAEVRNFTGASEPLLLDEDAITALTKTVGAYWAKTDAGYDTPDHARFEVEVYNETREIPLCVCIVEGELLDAVAYAKTHVQTTGDHFQIYHEGDCMRTEETCLFNSAKEAVVVS